MFSERPQLAEIKPLCRSRRSDAYTVPSLSCSGSSLICSMRRAIPYPCCGPITACVLSTIRSRVPWSTSVRPSPMAIGRCRTASSRWRCRELNPCPVAVFTRPRSPTTPPRRRGPAPGRRSTRRGRPRRRARPGASVAAPTPRRLADHPVPLTRPSPAGAAESEQRHCPGVERPALVEDDRPPLRRGNGPGWSPDGQSVSKKTEGAPGQDWTLAGQFVSGVLQHRDQRGSRFFGCADRFGKRQADGPRALRGLRGPSVVFADISNPYRSTPVMLAAVISVAFEKALQ